MVTYITRHAVCSTDRTLQRIRKILNTKITIVIKNDILDLIAHIGKITTGNHGWAVHRYDPCTRRSVVHPGSGVGANSTSIRIAHSTAVFSTVPPKTRSGITVLARIPCEIACDIVVYQFSTTEVTCYRADHTSITIVETTPGSLTPSVCYLLGDFATIATIHPVKIAPDWAILFGDLRMGVTEMRNDAQYANTIDLSSIFDFSGQTINFVQV